MADGRWRQVAASPSGRQRVVEEQGERRLCGEPGAGPGQERACREQPHRERQPDALSFRFAHAGEVGSEERKQGGGGEEGKAWFAVGAAQARAKTLADGS